MLEDEDTWVLLWNEPVLELEEGIVDFVDCTGVVVAVTAGLAFGGAGFAFSPGTAAAAPTAVI